MWFDAFLMGQFHDACTGGKLWGAPKRNAMRTKFYNTELWLPCDLAHMRFMFVFLTSENQKCGLNVLQGSAAAGLRAYTTTCRKLQAGKHHSLDTNLTHVNEGMGFDVIIMTLSRDLITCKYIEIAVCEEASSAGKP